MAGAKLITIYQRGFDRWGFEVEDDDGGLQCFPPSLKTEGEALEAALLAWPDGEVRTGGGGVN